MVSERMVQCKPNPGSSQQAVPVPARQIKRVRAPTSLFRLPRSSMRSTRWLPLLALLVSDHVANAQCITFGPFVSKGTLPGNLVPAGLGTQVSGMAASRHNPGVLWIHDDGDTGHVAQVVAVRTSGALAQQYVLTGVTNRDWEDVALGPGPVPGRDYLYLAEIGNNSVTQTTFSLVRVPEPDVPNAPGALITLVPEVFTFHYPSGTFNAETLFIDPSDGTPYILTKENTQTPSLFRYPMPLDSTVDKTLVLALKLAGAPAQFTGGTMSADGRWILARTYSAICVWPRAVGAQFAAAFAQAPCVVANNQGQAEAIALAPDGRSLWAVAEGTAAPIYNAPLTFPAGVPVWHAFGSGLQGGSGIPGLGADAAPRLGGPAINVLGYQASAGSVALFLLSGTGLPDGVAPFSGGWLHAVPDVLVLATTSSTGTCVLPLGALPDHPSLYGLSVAMQLLVADAAAAQGVALSAGLRLVLDR